MSPESLKERLSLIGGDADVQVTDLTGTHDHYQVRVVSSAFNDKTTMERHRLLIALVKKEIDSGELHALTLKTHAPGEIPERNKK